MVIGKRYFNSCTFYILLWVLYKLQGTLYASGSMISQALLAIILSLSIYYVALVNFSGEKLPSFLKILNVFLLMLTAYGIVAILDPTPIYFGNTLDTQAPKYEFLKTSYMSLLPIYVFYFFHNKGLLTEPIIRATAIILLIITTLNFIRYQNSMLAEAMSIRSTREDFTNNVAYQFLQLFPMVFFWNRKPLVQYLLTAYIFVFIAIGLKRGAMLIGAFCLMLFFYRVWKTSKGKQRWIVSILTVLIIVVGAYYLSDFYATSDYFQERMEQTAEGDSSGRDTLYGPLWEHFINETSLPKILSGNGAMQTINIVGNYAHNDWLEILTCHGLLGVFIYILYFIALIKHWLSSNKKTILFSMLGMIILILFSSTLFSMSYNSINLAISICLGYCLSQQKKYHRIN